MRRLQSMLRCTASPRRNRTAAHSFDFTLFSGGSVLCITKVFATRPTLTSRGVLFTALLWAGLALGTAALTPALTTPAFSQTSRDSAADRDMADRYTRAAQAGDDVAQFYLGSLYSAGVGRPQSDTDAFRWLESSAQRGNAQAMLVTGGMAALGKGTPKDYVVSYKWAFLVAEGAQAPDLKNGGRQLITMLEQRMSPDQVQRAKTMAYQFRAIGSSPAAAPAISPAPAATVAPAPVQTAPIAVAPAPAPPSLQPSSPGTQPGAAQTKSPAVLEAEKRLNKENVDKMIKNVPPEYRRRFGL